MLEPETVIDPAAAASARAARAPVPVSGRFMMAHPAHVMALGFGSGLSPVAPGTMGTLWAWALFALLQNRLTESQ